MLNLDNCQNNPKFFKLPRAKEHSGKTQKHGCVLMFFTKEQLKEINISCEIKVKKTNLQERIRIVTYMQ